MTDYAELKPRNIRAIFPNFQILLVTDNNHGSLHLTLKLKTQIFVLGPCLFFEANSFSLIYCLNCSLLGTDIVCGQNPSIFSRQMEVVVYYPLLLFERPKFHDPLVHSDCINMVPLYMLRYVGPVLWAKLPSHVRSLHSLAGFKRAVGGLDLEMLMDDSGCACLVCNA